MNDYDFGNFIYELRTEKGLSQSELGERLGVSNKAVSKWETGEAKPRPEKLLALAELFGITVEELLNGKRMKRKDGGEEVSIAIGVQIGEYRKLRRGLLLSVGAYFLTMAGLIITALIVFLFRDAWGTEWAGMLILCLLLFEIACIVCMAVLLLAMRKRRRLLYESFPRREEELNAMTDSAPPPKRRFKPSLILLLLSLAGVIALGQLLRLAGVKGEFAELTAYLLGLAVALLAVGSTHASLKRIRRLIESGQFSQAAERGEKTLRSWLPGTSSYLSDILRLNLAAAFYSLGNEEKFHLYLEEIFSKKCLRDKSFWRCVGAFSRGESFSEEYRTRFLPLSRQRACEEAAIQADILALLLRLTEGDGSTKERLLQLVKNQRLRKAIEAYPLPAPPVESTRKLE